MNSPVSLYDSFLGMEARVKKQQQLIDKYAVPVITIKSHVPTELRNRYANEIVKQSLETVLNLLAQQDLICIACDEHQGFAGKEFYLAVPCHSASKLKKHMIQIENSHPLGQLMDINVMTHEGKTISRSSSELAARICIICNCPAFECAKKNQHSVAELDNKIKSMFDGQCQAVV